MSEAPNNESKTELPTEKRRQDALERGNVPISREAINLGFMIALLIVATFSLEWCRKVAQVLQGFVEHPSEFSLESAADAAALIRALSIELMPVLAVVALFTAFSVGASILQAPPHLSTKRLAPEMSRISIAQGWRRIVSSQGMMEVLKSVVKLALIGGVGAVFMLSSNRTLVDSLEAPIDSLPAIVLQAMSAVIWQISGFALLLSVADILMTRFVWEKQLRMTRQEVRDEHRQQDGDPVLSARRRSIARNRIRKRMLANVPRATLVVVNPTHYAVAMRYQRQEGGAPRVVAKGADLIALQIRKSAEQHGIPVIEDKALARSLYKAVEVEQMIPVEFYRAVAEIMIMLQKRGNRRAAVALGG